MKTAAHKIEDLAHRVEHHLTVHPHEDVAPSEASASAPTRNIYLVIFQARALSKVYDIYLRGNHGHINWKLFVPYYDQGERIHGTTIEIDVVKGNYKLTFTRGSHLRNIYSHHRVQLLGEAKAANIGDDEDLKKPSVEYKPNNMIETRAKRLFSDDAEWGKKPVGATTRVWFFERLIHILVEEDYLPETALEHMDAARQHLLKTFIDHDPDDFKRKKPEEDDGRRTRKDAPQGLQAQHPDGSRDMSPMRAKLQDDADARTKQRHRQDEAKNHTADKQSPSETQPERSEANTEITINVPSVEATDSEANARRGVTTKTPFSKGKSKREGTPKSQSSLVAGNEPFAKPGGIQIKKKRSIHRMFGMS